MAYCQVAKPQVIEPFLGLNYPGGAIGRVEKVTVGPQGCTTNHSYNANQESDVSTGQIVQSQNNGVFSGNQQTQSNTQQMPQTENYQPQQPQQQPTDQYVGPNSFYTVPGTYQANIEPRFQNTTFGANITYDFPEQNKLAADPNDPMLLANQVENFEQKDNGSHENVQTKFAQIHEPIALPRTMDGPRENYQDSADGSTPQYKTYDRLIMSLAKNRLLKSPIKALPSLNAKL